MGTPDFAFITPPGSNSNSFYLKDYQNLGEISTFISPDMHRIDGVKQSFRTNFDEYRKAIIAEYLGYNTRLFLEAMQEVFGKPTLGTMCARIPEESPVRCRFDGEKWTVTPRPGITSYSVILKSGHKTHSVLDGHTLEDGPHSRNLPFRNRSQRRKNNESYSISF